MDTEKYLDEALDRFRKRMTEKYSSQIYYASFNFMLDTETWLKDELRNAMSKGQADATRKEFDSGETV